MQYYQDGYQAGDPRYRPRRNNDQNEANPDYTTSPSHVDVLIIGAGPAGLLLAAQLSQFPDLKIRLAELKDGPLAVGQADGVQCRSIEMFEAFGFSERVLREAYWVNEVVFWNSAADAKKVNGHGPEGEKVHEVPVVRGGRVLDSEREHSEFPHVILNQARLQAFFLDVMKQSSMRLEPTYSRQVMDLQVRHDETNGTNGRQDDHPVTIKLQRTDKGHEDEVETVRARYVVGCDGARSAVRRALNLSLEGDSANRAWGVMDVLAQTTFPDIRYKTVIHSANSGNILIIPREGGYMVRMYVELDSISRDLGDNKRFEKSKIGLDEIVQAARNILHPYTLDVKEVPWWSVYEIGQRLCPRFDDALPSSDNSIGRDPHVFIAGDACHTHSPKAGQGMNVSMQDAFNLGWKLSSVLRGLSQPKLLHTYSIERYSVAKELIDFDREWARLFDAAKSRPKESVTNGDGNEKNAHGEGSDGGDGKSPDMRAHFARAALYTAGLGTVYTPDLLTLAPPSASAPDPRFSASAPANSLASPLAKGFPVGARLHSFPVTRLCDAKEVELGHVVKADGRWRMILFGDNVGFEDEKSMLRRVCEYLNRDERSVVRKYTRIGMEEDAVFDVRAVVQQRHSEIGFEVVPEILRPVKGRLGLVDYEKVFCADLREGKGLERTGIFEARGVDKEGAIVVVRPDQYVAAVLPLDIEVGMEGLEDFFAEFMIATS